MKVAIIMGSKSDYPVVEKAEKMLESFGVEYETRIISAHRTPRQRRNSQPTPRAEALEQ